MFGQWFLTLTHQGLEALRLRRFAPRLRYARFARAALGVALRGFTYQNYYCNRFVSNLYNLKTRKEEQEVEDVAENSFVLAELLV